MKIGTGIHWISRGFFYFGLVAASVMLVITCYDVFMRYFFAKPTSWAVELSAVLLVYMGFICAAELVRRGQHIDMSVLVTRLSKRTQKRVDVFDSVLVILFCAVLVWMGSKATLSTYKYGMYMAGEFHMPLWVIYIVIPLGALFVGLEYLLHIIEMKNGGKDVS
jgi:TRAP-type C4-dicarboxylate transport system permease small subunit